MAAGYLFVLFVIGLVIGDPDEEEEIGVIQISEVNGAKKSPYSLDNNDGDNINVLGISSDYIYIFEIMVFLLLFITTISTLCRCVQNREQKTKNTMVDNEDNIQV